MSRVFKRGELKIAIAVVLRDLGAAHGYAIMSELQTRVGGGWKPSPGAIYPALLALVETGHVTTNESDGTRIYRLTEAGLAAAEKAGSAGRWASLEARAEAGEDRVAVGTLLDDFASRLPIRRRLAGEAERARIESILERTGAEIEQALKEGEE
ncbi:MAG: PadR family transcriptional regulator [Acidimicrobiia bacterium]